MIEDMRIRNLSLHTQRAYVEHVARFARHFGQPPERLGQQEIRTWQLHLVQERRLAASSISVAVAALRFLYKVTLKRPWIVEDDIPTGRQPKKLPVVPSPKEVARLLDAVTSAKHRMILTVCYATGLRISEAVSLRPAAIDSQRMVIRVETGKGRKVGSRTGAPTDRTVQSRHVSSPLRVARNMRISRIARPHLLRVRAYNLSHRGNFRPAVSHPIAVEQLQGVVQPLPTPLLPAEAPLSA
jgi:integrase